MNEELTDAEILHQLWNYRAIAGEWELLEFGITCEMRRIIECRVDRIHRERFVQRLPAVHKSEQ